MTKTRYKKFIQVLLGFILSIQTITAQPTPGSGSLGAGTGGTVGGSADLAINIWFVLALAIAYFLYKRKEQIFQWYLDLDWGDFSL